MIDLKQLRADPQRFIDGARDKNVVVDIERLLALDKEIRASKGEMESRRAEQKRLGRELGPTIGKLKGQLQSASGADREAIEREIKELERRPAQLKAEIQEFADALARSDEECHTLWLQVPQPPDPDVPKGRGPEDNVEIRRWNPSWFDPARSFEANKGFKPRRHVELVERLGLADFERAVRMSGTRHYALTGEGMLLHQAVLRFGFDVIVHEHGFRATSVPVLVREECMVGTGFFPAGREQAYHVEETTRGGGHDLFLAGTGEVGLMALHADEILSPDQLPLKYATLSTCFRREAGAAGKDTAGLYRIHQFDKVEQVVIGVADDAESRSWHGKMIGVVESILQRLELPYRLLECCSADLGPKNAAQIDIECWCPGRGESDPDGSPLGEYGETHSASRLSDFQCRRLNLRYRGEGGTVFCHSLNNTVVASPRILIPILETHQNEDGTVTVPRVLRPYMNGKERIG